MVSYGFLFVSSYHLLCSVYSGSMIQLSRRRTLLLCVVLTLFLVFFLSAYRHWQDWHDTLSYSTRPLWDHPDGPTFVLSRLHAEGLATDSPEACRRHGWTARSSQPSLVDAVLFSTETDLLEIRLRELDSVVDVFVVAESTHTLMGDERNITNPLLQPTLAPWKSKMRYYQYQGREMLPSEGPFALVNEFRRGVTAFIRDNVKPPSDSLILMADVDEIPSRATMELIKGCEVPLPLHLQMQNYIYSFEWPTDGRSWRAQVHSSSDGSPYMHGQASNTMLADAGWHCSFCFRHLDEFVAKMRGASHADRLYNRVNWRTMLSPDVIQDKICRGKDLFDMLPEAYTWTELLRLWKGASRSTSTAHLPRAVIEDSKRFSFLLPGGCKRER